MEKKITPALSVIALALAPTVVVLPSATAKEILPSNVVCTSAEIVPHTTEYRTTSKEMHVGNPENRVYGEPGMVITIEEGESWTTSGSISASVSGDISGIIAGVSAEVGIEVGIEKTSSSSVSASWTVPSDATERGWVEKGNNGYEVAWVKGHYEAPCNWVETDKGSALVVTHVPSFSHSEGLSAQ